MIRYVLEVAEPSCASELREVLSMTAVSVDADDVRWRCGVLWGVLWSAVGSAVGFCGDLRGASERSQREGQRQWQTSPLLLASSLVSLCARPFCLVPRPTPRAPLLPPSSLLSPPCVLLFCLPFFCPPPCVLPVSPLQEQQEERKAATEGRMLSEECNTEVNSKAAEFNSKLQVRGAKTAD